MTKTCWECKRNLSLAAFCKNRRKADGYNTYCKSCAARQRAEWDKAHPDKAKAHSVRSYELWRNRRTAEGSISAYYRQQNLRRNYGMSDEQYAQKMAEQGGVCAICGNPETFVRMGKVTNLAVDHDHETGQVRGLLCNSCNHAFGLFGEDEAVMLAAVAYLKQYQRLKLVHEA